MVNSYTKNACYPLDGDPHLFQAFTLGIVANGHVGVDWDVVPGTPVRACLDGWAVMVVQDSKVYGRFIAILHEDGHMSWYAHLSKTLIKKGTWVLGGTVIGLSGGAVGSDGAGMSTGWHLHFEVRTPGHHNNSRKNIDPLLYIQKYLLKPMDTVNSIQNGDDHG